MKIDELKKNIEAQIMKKEEEKRSKEHLIKLEKEKKKLEKETKAALKKKAILNRRKAEKELKSIDVKEKEKEEEKEEEEKVSTEPEIRYIVNSRPVNDSVTSVTVFDKMHQRYVCNLTTKNPDKAIENLIVSYGPGVTKISNWNN